MSLSLQVDIANLKEDIRDIQAYNLKVGEFINDLIKLILILIKNG